MTLRRPVLLTQAVAVATLLLGACTSRNETPPVPEPTLVELRAATPLAVTPEAVAEIFALNTEATSLQRDEMSERVSGAVVDWEITVYEVRKDNGEIWIHSEPIAIESKSATPTLRVAARMDSPDDSSLEVIRAAKTGQKLRIRGHVRSIVMRTFVVLTPALILP